jgi:cytochrome c oxidase assembly factor CtaG
MMVAGDTVGLPIPDAGPVFAAALAVHILCGLIAVIAGALAATAKKRPGRHPRAGRVYLWTLGGIFTTAAVMAVIRWRQDAHLFAIAAIAFSLSLYGYRARRRHRPGWPPHHAIGMGGSYIALLAGFYVDNGPFRSVPNREARVTPSSWSEA